jgi:hypothetical protein
MSFLMSADTVLLRLVEDEKALASQRVAALKQVDRVSTTLHFFRRLPPGLAPLDYL